MWASVVWIKCRSSPDLKVGGGNKQIGFSQTVIHQNSLNLIQVP